MNAVGCMVGDVNQSLPEGEKATYGVVGGLLFVISSFVLIRCFCLDCEGYPKKDGLIPLALLISFCIVLVFFIVIYILAF